MKYEFLPPPMPSIARFRVMRRRTPKASILRAMEYELLESLSFEGRILDFGGGRRASYVPLLPDDIELVSVNIDEQYSPTHLVAPEEPLPFEDESFDGAICLNVLEHIYDARFALDEMFRVLRPGATLHVSVPFIFRVHGHPDDYSRHTSSWWRATMQRVGFAQMKIQPLIWGRATSAQLIRATASGPGSPPGATCCAMSPSQSSDRAIRAICGATLPIAPLPLPRGGGSWRPRQRRHQAAA